MLSTSFWFLNLVAIIIIVKDLHPSYILNKKKTFYLFIFLSYYLLSLFTNPPNPIQFLHIPLPSLLPVPTNGDQPTPPPFISLFLPFVQSLPLSPLFPFFSSFFPLNPTRTGASPLPNFVLT